MPEPTAAEKAAAEKAAADKAAAAAAPAPRRRKPEEDTSTKKYRLKADVGAHYDNGELLEPGDVVELTARQFEAFGDKFDAV